MSYRIKVNDTQIFGNNEYPSPFFDLKNGCIKQTNCFSDKIHFHCYVQTDKITVEGS
ncbi:MAG: hypothetical protein BWY47_01575 [Bacteroidetes bacterium ADurb.Bin302]|nr:MAG: hypothetical protein BWY47_01575 [Bacteroidetes bacterium ADurb.Bin302]